MSSISKGGNPLPIRFEELEVDENQLLADTNRKVSKVNVEKL